MDSLEPRHQPHELARVGMRRRFEQGLGRGALADPSILHHHDAVAHLAHDREVVADEEDRKAGSVAQVLEQVQHLRLHRDVERRGRFVADQKLRPRGERAERQTVQMVFQDPYASLNPRLRVATTIAEPILFYALARSRAEAEADAALLLEAVGLAAGAGARFPHAFSGGQRQRVSIARALAARPALLICDEPTSSLDVSVQAQVLNLLKDLRDGAGLAILFISHDLAVVRQMCDRVVVMKDGRVCETAATETLFDAPSHPYTRELMRLVPRIEAIHRRFPAATG